MWMQEGIETSSRSGRSGAVASLSTTSGVTACSSSIVWKYPAAAGGWVDRLSRNHH